MTPKILVLADYPTKNEVSSPFAGAASMALKTSLRSTFALTDHPLKTKAVKYSYLSSIRPQAGLDTEVFSRKELPKEVLNQFHQVEYLPETYISDYLHIAFKELLIQIKEFEPDIIITSGKWVFYLLACYTDSPKPPGRLSQVKSSNKSPNLYGLNMKFRGSIMTVYKELGLKPCILIPIIPHAYQAQTNAGVAILKDYCKIAYLNSCLAEGQDINYWLDFKPNTKVFDEFIPAKRFLTDLLARLDSEIVELSVDLENVAKSIDTIGFAWSSTEGFAIPFLRAVPKTIKKFKETVYDKSGKELQVFFGSTVRTYEYVFSLEEEIELIWSIKKILTHGNVRLIGHNFHYDGLLFKELWNLEVHASVDTMILAACLNNQEKKNLAYLCSTNLEHYAYWKDDLNSTNSIERWHYCAKDSMFTFGLKEVLWSNFQSLPLKNQNYYLNKQNRTAKHLLRRMFGGLEIDVETRQKLDEEFSALYDNAIEQIQLMVGYELNIRSTPQIRALLIDCLNIDPILDRKRKTPTFGNAAMLKYIAKYPHYSYLLYLILEAKSIATYLQNFMRARLDEDNRLRSFIGIVGTKSYRFNSRKFLNGLGANIMNWSTGKRSSLVYSCMELEYQDETDSIDSFGNDESIEDNQELIALAQQESKLVKIAPNSKQIVIPRKGTFFVNVDLSAGDLHFVAYMSGAKWIIDCLKSGGDVYTELGSEYYGTRLLKSDERRQKFKMVCHALNYLGMFKTISLGAGLDELAVMRIAEFYFSKNPEIPKHYQQKIIQDCVSLGYTENPFGARYYCPTTDTSVDKTWMQKMVALPAQGGVADYINEVLDCSDEREPFEQYPMTSKLQIHDAGLWEVDNRDKNWKDRIDSYFGGIKLPVDCPDGTSRILTIPWDISYSEKNYAECK